MNVDTGFVLTEVFRGSSKFVEDRGKFVGVRTSLRDSTGKLVLHRAGQLVVDFSTFEVVKVTPGRSIAREDICRAMVEIRLRYLRSLAVDLDGR